MTTQSEEQIRKIYVRDLKLEQQVHTVFRAVEKQKITSRSGKTFISLSLQDRTGAIDARIFDNVEHLQTAFVEGDYLLVKGKTTTFHGKPQLVIDTLERLDSGPIDAKEFAWTAPPAEAREAREPREPKEPRAEKGSAKAIRQKILALLDDPQVAQGLDALLKHLDRHIDERIEARMSGRAAPEKHNGKGPRVPRVEHRPHVSEAAAASATSDAPVKEKDAPKPAPERDPSLPKDLAFKPFSMLTGETPPSEPKS